MSTTSMKKANTGKIASKFRIRVRSRHPSHNILRTALQMMPFRAVIRLGSVTPVADSVANGGKCIEINTIESIRNSANKHQMKECFDIAGVKTAQWFYWSDGNLVSGSDETKVINAADLPYPVVVKHVMGSRGTGNTLCKDLAEFNRCIAGKDLGRYIVEKFHNFSKEYRLHITKDGCFYTCRKMLKKDTPDAQRWYKNDSNSVWILEDNPAFEKPSNWDAIVAECVKALHATELDVCSFDLRCQSETNNKGKKRDEIDFIIIECNSASSFGEVTAQKYLEIIPQIATAKAKEYGII